MPLTRRSFLAGLPAAPAIQARPASRVRVAIIGLEGHPHEITAPLKTLPEVEVVAVAAPEAAVREFVARQPGAMNAKAYADYRRMLDEVKPDLVAVCNTNGDRAAATLNAVERGLPVIAEKPLATNRSDLQRIKRAVAEHRTRLGMLLPMRYEPEYRAIKQIADSGDLGEVIQISAQKSYQLGDRPDWFKHRSTYGSTILWIGVHMVDLMLWAGRQTFTHATSFMGRAGFPELGDMETTTSTSFRLANGGTATLHMDYCQPPTASAHGDDRLRLAGTKGVVEYMAGTGVTLVSTKSKLTRVTELPPRGSVFADFVQYVFHGRPPSLTIDEIYAACDATIAAHESAVEGRIVAV